MTKRMIVIGGVAAGTSAASRARRTGPDLEIILFEKGPYISYGACDEPYFIAGEVPNYDGLLVRRPEVFRQKQNIDIRLHHEVTDIDAHQRIVTVCDRQNNITETLGWDSLVLATGARPRLPDLPGCDAANVFSLKTLTSAIALKEFIEKNKPRRVVTLGAGFIALEMAEAFAALGIENTILHRGTRPGGRLEPEIAEKILDVLETHDVPYVNELTLERFVQNSKGLVEAVETDKQKFDADLVLAGIGVDPCTELAGAAGVRLGPTGAIAVDARQETNVKGVYAAGDCCESYNLITGKAVFTPLGDIANKQGWTAGENAAGGDIAYPGPIGSWQFKCFELEVASTGLLASEAQEAGFEVFTNVIKHRSRTHAQPKSREIVVKLIADRATHRILGGQMAGREGAALRIQALAVAVTNGMTVEQLAGVDFAYAPPFSPVIDPILIAARDATKRLACLRRGSDRQAGM